MQKKKPVSYLLDFDSTFIKIEGLDALAEVSLENHPHKETLVKQIKELTNLGMEGKISFEESLKKRSI
jgi:D-3-phosphoglycerate dehydrogenase / 2-oxoglutarate reductase